MAFDPDQYLKSKPQAKADKKSAEFDPNAYLEKNQVSGLKSFSLGAAQGVSFGFADELAGAASAIKAGVTGKDTTEAYTKTRDEVRETMKDAAAQNPKSFLAGEFSSILVPGSVIGKGATVAGRIGRSAIAGGTTAAGMTEKSPVDNPTGFIQDVASGAALGAGSSGLLEFVGRKAAGLAPEKLRAYAAERAVKASGAMKGDFNRIQKTVGVEPLGRKLIDEKIVTPFASLETVAERAAVAKEKAGEEIGAALQKVDDLVEAAKKSLLAAKIPPKAKADLKKQIDEEFQFSTKQIGTRIEKELIHPNLRNAAGGLAPANLKDPGLRVEMEKLQSLANDYKAGKPLTLVAGGGIKARQGKQTKFASDTIPETFKKEVYGIVKTQLDNVVDKTEALEEGIQKLTGAIPIGLRTPGEKTAGAAYKAAKATYGAAKESESMALNRLGGVQSNRGVSLTDTIAGAGALAGGYTAPAVIALGALNKFGRQYGATMQMYGADKLADILASKPSAVAIKYLGPIADAATKGPLALMATHRAFMKDPEYRQQIGAEEIEANETGNAMSRRAALQGGK